MGHRSWGTVEQAVHSHRKVEELLFHLFYLEQWLFAKAAALFCMKFCPAEGCRPFAR